MKIYRIAKWEGQIDETQELAVSERADNIFMQIYYTNINKLETNAQKLVFLDEIIRLFSEQRDKFADEVIMHR